MRNLVSRLSSIVTLSVLLAVAGLPSPVSGQIISLPANPQFQNLFLTTPTSCVDFDFGDITLCKTAANTLTLAGGDLNLASTYLTFTDTYISRDAANTFLFGKDAAAPANYTLKAADATGAGPTAGASLSLQGGTPAGASTYGNLILQPSGGKAAIRIATPLDTLHIQVSVPTGVAAPQLATGITIDHASEPALQFRTGTTGVAYIFFGDDDADVGSIRYDFTDNFFAWRVNTADRMRINSSGYLGVATTIPRYQNTTIGVLSSLLSDDGTNYEGLTITPAAGTVTLAAVTAGTGTDNIDLAIVPAGTGALRYGVTVAGGALLGTLTNSVAVGDPTIYLKVCNAAGTSCYAVPGWLIP